LFKDFKNKSIMDDFPKATPPPPPPKEMTPEEGQLQACKDVIAKLTASKYCGAVTFSESLFPSVLEKLEKSGFEVTYMESYTTKSGKSTYVTIMDNGLRASGASGAGGENKSQSAFNVSPELKDGLTSLLDMFVGSSGSFTSPLANVSGATFKF
jgi:hypothetical protein